jgi:hypothetical protein
LFRGEESMSQPKNKKISRRDAMKVLGAAAGATLLANLPSKWSKPELTNGVLPAHAQTSGILLTFTNIGFISGLVKSGDSTKVSAPLGAPGCAFDGIHWVEISEQIANIPLVLEVTSDGPVNWFTPGSNPTGIYYTDSKGKVEINLNMQYSSDIVFTWTFKNASDGTGSIVDTLLCNSEIINNG